MEGSDDMFFDAKEYHTTNKNVANILEKGASSEAQVVEHEKIEEATLEHMDGEAWGDEEEGIDIDMGDDHIGGDADKPIATGDPLLDGDATTLDSDIFVPPSSGADPMKQALKKNPQNVGLHIVSGEFSKALELLRKQLAIHDFSILKQAFVDIHSLSTMKLQSVPHMSPIGYQLRFIDTPLVVVGLSTLQKIFKKGIEHTTKGHFNGAITAFRQCLQFVPLIVVNSEQSMKQVDSLIKRLVEYITAMRIELERKRLVAAGSEDIKR